MSRYDPNIPKTGRTGVPRFLAYALLRDKKDSGHEDIVELDGFDLYDVPLGSRHSFLDFDGVVLFVGSFERIPTGIFRMNDEPRVEFDGVDLDCREQQSHSLFGQGRPIVFLVKPIPKALGHYPISDGTDLFRRFMRSMRIVQWTLLDQSIPGLPSQINEFSTFMERYGAASVGFSPLHKDKDAATIIAGTKAQFYGFEVMRKVFFLPCHAPNSHDEAVQMAAEAIRAVVAYRRRIAEDLPGWVADFQFTNEATIREKIDQLRTETVRLEAELEVYTKLKGALCFRSDPLVRVVVPIVELISGLRVESDEKKIEDAKLFDQDGKVVAVMEIKGVNGGFARDHVNQVDSHRERLQLGDETPGLLIINSKMTAESLADKDEPPHPDIITKAAQDNVLCIRTLDLLRYVDLIERGAIAKVSFRETLLNESGWLRVQDDKATVVRE